MWYDNIVSKNIQSYRKWRNQHLWWRILHEKG
nr:MAG TPA: hypothetical protein [Caudoviricetes sp.]DAV43158.1 MAG TPA: hypothetical protein [Caudoviricetes sp.]